METKLLQEAQENLSKLIKRKRDFEKQIEIEITKQRTQIKKYKKLTRNPILKILKKTPIYELKCIVYDYLDLDYCEIHNSYFPKILETCLGCVEFISANSKLIWYKLTDVKISKKRKSKKIEIKGNWKDDYDFKQHFCEILNYELRYCTPHIRSNELYIGFAKQQQYSRNLIVISDEKKTSLYDIPLTWASSDLSFSQDFFPIL